MFDKEAVSVQAAGPPVSPTRKQRRRSGVPAPPGAGEAPRALGSGSPGATRRFHAVRRSPRGAAGAAGHRGQGPRAPNSGGVFYSL